MRDKAKQDMVVFCNKNNCKLSNEWTGTDRYDGTLFGVYDVDVAYSDGRVLRQRRAWGAVYGDGQPYGWFYNMLAAPSNFMNYADTWTLMLNSTDFATPR
ncbi:MAG: hypothetical protein U0232_30265 [Thermomicrobiales bacterium]